MKDLTFCKSIRYIHRFCILCILLWFLLFFSCGGGFKDDNANADTFKNAIFQPDKVDTTDQ